MKRRNRNTTDTDHQDRSSIVLSDIIKWLYISISALSTAMFIYQYLIFLALRPYDGDNELDVSVMHVAPSNGCIHSVHEMIDDISMIDDG